MEAVPFKSLLSDYGYYVKTFQVYARIGAKYKVLTNWTNTVFKDAVVLPLKENVQKDRALRLLGIGSGSGEIEMAMIDNILSIFSHINNTVVEPATDHIELYTAAAEKSPISKDVTFEWNNESMDQFRVRCQTAGDNSQFDFISSVHALYYAEDPEAMLMYLYSRLKETGIILLIVVAEDAGFENIWNRFLPDNDGLMNKISSRHVKKYLEKHNIPYKVNNQPVAITIDSICDPNDPEGKLMTDFLSHTMDVTDPKIADDIIDYLKGEKCSFKKDGSLYFKGDWDAIVIRKN